MITKPHTLILAGDHQQFMDYCKTMGVSPYNGGIIEGDSAHAVGLHFDYIIIAGTFRARADAREKLAMARAKLNTGGKVCYADLHEGWYNSGWDFNGDSILHDSEDALRCNWCRRRTSETYQGGFCSSCVNKGETMPSGIKAGGLHKVHPPLPTHGNLTFPSAPKVRTVGEIWKIDKNTSPMWTEQWGYQGTSKAPYIVSHRPMSQANGSTTSDGWACSCMSFTRNTPRTPCKHILNVMLKEGLGKAIKPAVAKMANVDDAKLKAFEKWEREQTALKSGHKPTAGAKLNLFGATTRKFR